MSTPEISQLSPEEAAKIRGPIIGLKKGYFITFEGADGAGKTTQVNLIKEALEMTGFVVRTLREPGGCKLAEAIRDIIKDVKYRNMCAETELLLINAARAQLVRETIKPALEAGEIVVCDRYYHSTIVYQGFGRQLDQQMVKASVQFAIEDVIPDVTFVLYFDNPEDAIARKGARGTVDRIESSSEDFQNRVNAGIEWLRKQEQSSKGRIIALNANNTIEKIHNEIYRCCAARINELDQGQLTLVPEKKIVTKQKYVFR